MRPERGKYGRNLENAGAGADCRRAQRAEALMQEYLERFVRYGGPNGFSVLAGLSPHVLEKARCSASRVLVKDNTDVKGMHTAARGCADPRQSQYDGVCQLYVVENTERFQRARRAGLQCVWKGRGSERLQYGVRGCCFGGLCAAAIGTDTSFFVAGCAAENGAWLAFRARQCADCIAAGQCWAAGAHLCGCGLVYSAMRAEALEPLYAPEAGRLRLAVNTFWEETVPEVQKALFRGVLDVFIRTVVHPYQPMQKDAIRCAFRHGL